MHNDEHFDGSLRVDELYNRLQCKFKTGANTYSLDPVSIVIRVPRQDIATPLSHTTQSVKVRVGGGRGKMGWKNKITLKIVTLSTLKNAAP